MSSLLPATGDPRRRWAPQKFTQVGDAPAKQGAVVAINGTALFSLRSGRRDRDSAA